MAEQYEVNHDVLTLTINDERVTIDKFGTNVRRQVRGTGHEVFLRDIKELTFKSISFGTRIKVMTLEGEVYEKTIRYYD